MIREYSKDGFKHLLIGNEFVEVVFLPELGSKMISMVNLKTGTQFLLGKQDVGRTYKRAFQGADYSLFDASGFDECFPTIEKSELLIENGTSEIKKIMFPDHGELWSKEWDFALTDNSIIFSAAGVKADYKFYKSVELIENRIIIKYTLNNNSAFPFKYIWSGHPLLIVEEGDKIIVPPETEKLFLNWTSDPKLGQFGDYMQLADLQGLNNRSRFINIQNRETGIAIKGFTDILRNGFAGLFREKKNESFLIKFDTEKLPYLGIWLCYGGWPQNSERKHYTVALEPTSGRPDSLSESVKRNECSVIEIGQEKNWQVEFSLWEGIPDI